MLLGTNGAPLSRGTRKIAGREIRKGAIAVLQKVSGHIEPQTSQRVYNSTLYTSTQIIIK